MLSKRQFWISVTALAALTAGAFAHGGATGIVKQRMDGMTTISDATKTLASMMRGAQPYDADAVSEAAGIIRSHAGDALTDLFPEGSLNHPSEAKPVIWTDWSEFEALATRLADVATGLEMAAGNGLSGDSASAGGLAGLTPEQMSDRPPDVIFKALAQTCSDCHGKFRVKKN